MQRYCCHHTEQAATTYRPAELARRVLLREQYRIDQTITTTELNTVYRATDLATAREVIIKTARRGRCTYDQHVHACFDLAGEGAMLRTLRRLGLPAPRYLDHFHIEGRPYLVMTRIRGRTMEELWCAGQLDPRQVIEAIVEVCDHVQSLHQLNFVHHDIKPANIIIRPDSTVVLIDWGSAQRIRARGTRRQQSFTPDFASEEQIRGEALPGNDVFALGKTLGALIPWPGSRICAIIRRATARLDARYPGVDHLQRALLHLLSLEQFVNWFGLTALQGNAIG